ncbi:MAG: DnaJ C-terminal domain-containing protein [Castellaniella sp.]
MKFVDYYKALGVARDASQDEIRKAYRRLAHKYHPDVAGTPEAEEKFKDISVAYATLKDPEKRAAYDELGQRRPGEDFVPPHQWRNTYTQDMGGFDETDFSDVDLADLLAAFAAARQKQGPSSRHDGFAGQDVEVIMPVTLEQVFTGAETEVSLKMPDIDARGQPHTRLRSFQVHIPKGAGDGQRLRLAGQGGPGFQGGPKGDLYLILQYQPHRLYRVSGKDLYLDLPLAPWEAALGAEVEIPTLAGRVSMTVPAATTAGRQFRLAGRGLPGTGKAAAGHLYAIASIALPTRLSDRERELFQALASESGFRPRDGLFRGDAR